MTDEFLQRLLSIQPYLFKVASKLCRNPSDIEDLVSRATIKAWMKRDKFDGAKLTLWAAVVMKNLHFDELRRQKARPVIVGDSDLPFKYCGTTEQNFETVERFEKICRYLSRQKNGQFLIDYAMGWKYEEIAEKHGKPLGTVKVTIKRLRQLVSERFK